jgi:hypothetical protein
MMEGELGESLTGVDITEAGIIVVGSPVGTDAYEMDFAAKVVQRHQTRFANLRRMCHAQSQLLVLRAAVMPSFMHLFRSVPPRNVRDAAELVDKMAKMELDEIVGVRLDDLERKYASLPIKKGGLGISSYSDIGWSAYFSSLVEAAQCFKDVGIWEEETSMDHHWIIEASKDEIQELVQMIAELRQGQVEDKRGEGVLFPLSMQELTSTVPKAQKRLTALIHTRN